MASYLNSVKKQFQYYKSLADKTVNQIEEEDLFWQYNEESNSIAIIMQHIAGNMLSRWTDFMVTDGEKDWRNRDTEFENQFQSKDELLTYWEKGWICLFEALDSLTENDLEMIIYIRNEPHTVIEAINRQLAHYPYHVGQIVFLGKMIKNKEWKSLSIPKNESQQFNKAKFNNCT